MPSFDIVSEVDKQEIRNAMDQVNKEVATRFDFKGSDARVEQTDYQLTVYADDDFKLEQILDILRTKLTKRNVDVRCLDIQSSEKISGIIKDSKMKVQASIQSDTVRVTGSKKDLLQEAIQLVKKTIQDFPVQFQNFRD